MNMPIRFDIIEFTKTLTESGVPQDQAEAHALALSQAMNEGTPSSSELVLVRHELLMRMDVLKLELLGRMELLKQDMLGQMGVLKQELLGQMGVLKQDLLGQMDVLKQDFNVKTTQLRTEVTWFGGLSLVATLINTGMLIYLIAGRHI